ncbi:hypothetical protein M0P98_05295 [bacterium]|nr:hypothetical protein [bacterium]
MRFYYSVFVGFFLLVCISLSVISIEASEDSRIKLDFSKIKNNSPVDWQGSRGGTFTNFSYDEKEGIATFSLDTNWRGFSNVVELTPGRYILRAVAKSNSFAPKLYLDKFPYAGGTIIFTLALGVSDEFKEVVLPFYVEGKENKQFKVGIARVYQDPAPHKAIVQIKEMEIVRLGDTVLPDNWATTLTKSSSHDLDLLKEITRPDRPGKVIFKDSLIGTELWLMTQGGQTNLSYAGSQDFSNEGKFLHAGHRVPGDIVKTDGTFHYMNPLRGKPGSWASRIMWLFPWEVKRLPAGSNPYDWICVSRNYKEEKFLNLETGATHKITFPVKPNWQIIQTPSENGGRGPKLKFITQETLVWRSDDKKQIGVSDIEGNKFQAFKIKSISNKPENDVIYPSGTRGTASYAMNSAWGKSGKNWINATDKSGMRYFLFELNRNNHFTDENPYQVWALPLTLDNNKGLLKVVSTPDVEQLTWQDVKMSDYWQGGNWWNLAGGSHRSGDNAVLLLEDGTLLNMNALGMHSNFWNTISVNSPYDRKVRYIGSFPDVDHVSWPHEFKRDNDYAFAWSKIAPTVPFIMIDLKHDTMWTVAAKNSVDLAERAAASARLETPGKRGSGRGLARLIWSHPNPSPDYTKVIYASSMLTVEHPDYPLGDTYVAIVRYPMPPENLKIKGKSLSWEKPHYHDEIKGYNLYSSTESGRGYSKINKEPIQGETYTFSTVSKGFYVMTSVEHSGLESRRFSNEVQFGTNKRYRHYYEAELGDINRPMVPFFEPKHASDSYAVGITDPEMVYKEGLSKGLKGNVSIKVNVPVKGSTKLMGRVRGMSQLECETFTTGWKQTGEIGSGSFVVKIDGRQVGKIPVKGYEWKWVPIDTGVVSMTKGEHIITFETGDTRISLDNILVTNDRGFVPSGKSNQPSTPPSVPSGLKTEGMVVEGKDLSWGGRKVKAPYFKLLWNESQSAQGVRYYNIYRSETPKFDIGPSTLAGSVSEPVFVDCVLEPGRVYYYKVTAIDNWDNSSAGSEPLPVRIK